MVLHMHKEMTKAEAEATCVRLALSPLFNILTMKAHTLGRAKANNHFLFFSFFFLLHL